MELKQLEESINLIGRAISEKFDNENPDEVVGKLQELASLQGLASHCLAQAKRMYNAKIANLIISDFYKDYTATDRKLIFQKLAAKELYLLNLIDRYVANISHSIDSTRSILSYLKLEWEQSKFQTT